MDLDQQIAEAMRAELERQAENGGLTVAGDDTAAVTLNGKVDLESLAQVVIGHVAGGP
jgi:hypothetical protein